MECNYYGDKEDTPDIDSEYINERVITRCNADAIHVLRLVTIPQNQVQAHLLYKRICVCQKHGEYLCNDAPFKWENLPNLKAMQVKEEMLITNLRGKD